MISFMIPVVDGPCNGLLLLKCGDRLAFWNPSTREFKLVLPSTIRGLPGIERTDFNAVGGMDSIPDQYKVIRFVPNYVPVGMDQINQVDIYSLYSNSWREMIPAPKELVNGRSWLSFGDLKNGFYHWCGAGKYEGFIIAFDLTNESFTSTALPEFEGSCLWHIIEQLNGAMRLIAIHDPHFSNDEMCFDIWVKKDRWNKELSTGPFHGDHWTFGSCRNGQMLFRSNGFEPWLLDFESRETKKFEFSTLFVRGVMSSESLVPINGTPEQQEGIVHEKLMHQL